MSGQSTQDILVAANEIDLECLLKNGKDFYLEKYDCTVEELLRNNISETIVNGKTHTLFSSKFLRFLDDERKKREKNINIKPARRK